MTNAEELEDIYDVSIGIHSMDNSKFNIPHKKSFYGLGIFEEIL